MYRSNLFFKIAGPTLVVSILLFGSCVSAALFLYRQEAAAAQVLEESVSSRRVARLLENTLSDLIALLRDGSDRIDEIHARMRELLSEASRLADKPEERAYLNRLEDSFARYRRTWEAFPAHVRTAGGAPIEPAVAILDAETWPTSSKLRDFNANRIEGSVATLARGVVWMGWGLVGVGTVAAAAGLILGYGVASGLGRTIHKLSVQIRDAEGKLGQGEPAVILELDDLQRLPSRMQAMIGEIEQVVERLRQREREVMRSDQLAAVGQLAAGMAHEIRNPLTAIKMLIQAHREDAEAGGLPPEDSELIIQEIRRIERQIQVFLDFARPPRPERRPLDLVRAVERTVALVSWRARRQTVAIDFAPPDEPVRVEADAEQVQQLLVNLALNALDAMPRGGVLRFDLRLPEGGPAELSVSDTGPGIAPKVLSRLFEPFVSGKEAGVGLGLAISRRIAEGHGGYLKGENLPGGGARFTLGLPAGRGEAPTLAIAAPGLDSGGAP